MVDDDDPVKDGADRKSSGEPVAHRPEPHQARKRGWLPIDTVAVIVAAMTTFAVAYSPNQDGTPSEGVHIVDVVFGVVINVALVYAIGWPIRWAWRKFKS